MHQPVKIAVAALMQEVNTFTALRGVPQDWDIVEGAGAFRHPAWSGRNAARGAWELLRNSPAVGVVPGVFAIALPGGPLGAADGSALIDRVARSLVAAGKPDGVLLILHGSMIFEGEFDPEGLLAERIRRELGPEVPVVAALDMHAKFTPRLERNIDGLTAYKTAPHTDEDATGAAAARMLLGALQTGVRPLCRVRRLPILLAGEKSETHAEPMAGLIAAAREWEQQPGIAAASLLLGFPWADTAHAGVSCIASGIDPAQCAAAAEDLARRFLAARPRFDFTMPAVGPEEALWLARTSRRTPLFLSDSGDNPTAGATQNMTWFAARLEEEGIGPCLLPAIADAAAYRLAAAARTGDAITVPIGTIVHGRQVPFLFACRLERLVAFEGTGVAVLRGKSVTCLITNRRVGTLDLSLVRACGIDVAGYRCVVVKCGYQGAECRAAAAESFLVLTPGDTDARLEILPFHKIPRPMWPLDPDLSTQRDAAATSTAAAASASTLQSGVAAAAPGSGFDADGATPGQKS